MCCLIQLSLGQLIRSEAAIVHPGAVRLESDDFKFCDMRLHPQSECVTFRFTFRGEQRSLKLHLYCDCDHKELGPQSLAIRLGAFGESELFIRTALYALSVLGPAYIDVNDCDQVGFESLGERPPTMLELIHSKYVSHWRLEAWVRLFDRELRAEGKGFEEFFGFERQWFEEVLGPTPIADRNRCFTELAPLSLPPTPQFLLEFHQRSAA